MACLFCEASYYLNATNNCVKASKCEIGYYANKEERICDKCNIACEECDGGNTNFDCTRCNKNYIQTKQGNCLLLRCNDGEFLDFHERKCKSIDLLIILYIYIYISIYSM